MSGSRSYKLRAAVLPWVLGALVLRALIPAGFMPMPGGTLSAAMCSTLGMSNELIEIPGTSGDTQCDYCVAPSFGSPNDPVTLFSTELASQHPLSLAETPSHRLALARSQSARGPPA